MATQKLRRTWILAVVAAFALLVALAVHSRHAGAAGAAAAAAAGGSPAEGSQAAMPGMQAAMPGMDGSGAGSAAPDTGAMDGAMSHEHMGMGLHMKMTAPRPRQPGDDARAAAIVRTLKAAIVKYKDYHQAEADGFAEFLPRIRQPIYHFTNARYAVRAQLSFDPARPTSLLYKPVPVGGFELIGAMYTAPRGYDEDRLDARVPLSITSWHQHVNICLPSLFTRPAPAAGAPPRFGPIGTIATAAACRDAGGTFHPVVFGWMVHVYPFETDTAKIFAH